MVLCEDESNDGLKCFSSLDDFKDISDYELVNEAYRDDGRAMVRLNLSKFEDVDIEVLGKWELKLGVEATKDLLNRLK